MTREVGEFRLLFLRKLRASGISMPRFSYKKYIARGIADGFLGPDLNLEVFLDRMEIAVGAVMPWMPRLFEAVHEAYQGRFDRVGREELAEFILRDNDFLNAIAGSRRIRIRQFTGPAESMKPEFQSEVPAITEITGLRAMLGIPDHHLDWFSDSFATQHRVSQGPLQHYTYRWVFKKGGSARLLEMPKYRLKEIQRSILKLILDKIPVHAAAHGFVKGRSCLTGLKAHAKSSVILKMDLKNFFLNIHFGRVSSLFIRAGYPEKVSWYLAGLCTNVTPKDILEKKELRDHDIQWNWEAKKKFNTAHLPQGAPSSPAISNLCAYKMDLRLCKAAEKTGAVYTRYADDLVFSGGISFLSSIRRFHDLVCKIIHDEGFMINHRKTRIMKQGIKQKVCGIVLNEHPNIDRRHYDALKAQLHNCVRFGPESQNRSHEHFKEHLLGKIAYVRMINPSRAEKLYALFNRVNWG